MNPLLESEAGYIAGIMDGEGCIAVNRARKKQHHNWTYKICVNVTNTNREVLEWIQKVTGRGKITPKPRKAKWKLCYQLVFSVQEAYDFIVWILPYMRVRKRQAELMLEFLRTCHYHSSNALDEKEVVLREVVCQEMETLNKRGT